MAIAIYGHEIHIGVSYPSLEIETTWS